MKFDLADAFFRKRRYQEALDAANQVSEKGRQDDSYLALLGDIYTHLGDTAHATEIFRDAIHRNPDNDQYYLSLALAQLRSKTSDGAAASLRQGLARIPSSGKISWGLGVISVLEGKRHKLPNGSSAPSISFPNGPAATPRSASSTIRPAKSRRPANSSLASKAVTPAAST